ncbi:putative membrane protein [Clostridium bornimense]|uniref:Putative membrane protein n=1 Tax=Clostridium bornimense TaxID=1216932 RepID=W6RZV4_9CLOT|nr:hypothetical protein [Clostridium bornimense]CDM67547.1 putative membrane protein [Clostridium bornimense]
MERYKKILLKTLFPNIAIVLSIVIFAALGLAYVFFNDLEENTIAITVYSLSFYALCVIIARIITSAKRINVFLHENSHTARYLSEAEFRARISLHIGTLINIGYAIFKLIAGILYSSNWFGVVATYYMVLSLIRFLLISNDHQAKKLKENISIHQWKSYRLCGILLLLLNVTMSVMIFQMIWQNKGYSYPDFIIYGSATYTFYRLTISIVGISSKKIASPVLSAAKLLDLSIALMAMFSLQTAMLSAFGTDIAVNTCILMNALTGGAVCLTVVCIAVYMIVKARKRLLNVSKEV